MYVGAAEGWEWSHALCDWVALARARPAICPAGLGRVSVASHTHTHTHRRGSDAVLRRGLAAQAQSTTGLTTADLVGATHMGRPEARDYPVLRVGGNAWGGTMTMCPDHRLSAEFWSHVKPSHSVRAEVDAFVAEKLSTPPPPPTWPGLTAREDDGGRGLSLRWQKHEFCSTSEVTP